MRIRRTAELKRIQARMLANMRAIADPIVNSPTVDPPNVEAPTAGMLGLARVVSVVADDPDKGAHLVVVRSTCSGVPPTFADDSIPAQVAYPAPGHVVNDYAADAFVLCCRVDGTIVAIKLT